MTDKPKLPLRKDLYKEIAAAINSRDLSQILSEETLKAYPSNEARIIMRRVVADVATYCIEATRFLKEDVW